MSSEIGMFYDLSRGELKKFAQLVIAGEAKIKVLIKDNKNQPGGQSIALPFNGKHEYGRSDLLEPFWSRLITRNSQEFVERRSDWVGPRHCTLYDSTKLTKFLEENDCILKPGFYEVFEGVEIANEILTIPEIQLSQIVFGACVGSILFEGRRMALYRSEIFSDKYRNAVLNRWFSPNENECAFFLESNKPKRQPATEVDYILNEFLDATNGKGGKPQLSRYMVNTVEAEFIPPDRFEWADPTGTHHKKSEKTLLNRLSQLKRKRKE